MNNFTVKSMIYFLICIALLYPQIMYAQNASTYFIGLQASQSEQTMPFVYICAPVDTTVPPSYICAPTSMPTITINQAAQMPKVYPQTLKTSDVYNYNPYAQYSSPQYGNLGASTSAVPYSLSKYRPYAIDSNENYKNIPQSLPPAHQQNISTEPSPDFWSPTSNFGAWQSQSVKNSINAPIYPQNPYGNNIRNNVWQTAPQYRPDKNMSSAHSNPFHSQPAYQSEINR